MKNSPLVVENLTKHYNSKATGVVKAVNEVSFSLNPGEVFGLLGPNGAGKTSIISTIVTLETPTSGQITVNGYDNQVDQRLAKRQVGFVPQEIINHGFFSVIEILRFQSGYYGLRDNDERIRYLLHELSLYEHRDKKVKQLSGGMKRRLLIAKALVHQPKLLLLDEPTAGVDIDLRRQLWEFVKKLKSENVTVLLTTHYLEEAELLCDRIGILDNGYLKMLGPTRDLISQFTERVIKIKLRGHNKSNEYHVRSHQTVGQVLSDQKIDLAQIEDISIVEGRLEDAFRRVISGKQLNGAAI